MVLKQTRKNLALPQRGDFGVWQAGQNKSSADLLGSRRKSHTKLTQIVIQVEQQLPFPRSHVSCPPRACPPFPTSHEPRPPISKVTCSHSVRHDTFPEDDVELSCIKGTHE